MEHSTPVLFLRYYITHFLISCARITCVYGCCDDHLAAAKQREHKGWA